MLDEVPADWRVVTSLNADWRIWQWPKRLPSENTPHVRWLKQYTGARPAMRLQYSIGGGYQTIDDPEITDLWLALDWLKGRHPWAHLR